MLSMAALSIHMDILVKLTADGSLGYGIPDRFNPGLLVDHFRGIRAVCEENWCS